MLYLGHGRDLGPVRQRTQASGVHADGSDPAYDLKLDRPNPAGELRHARQGRAPNGLAQAPTALPRQGPGYLSE
jgi:hypothetical protein